MATVDSLDIQISASASKAIRSLNTLYNSVEKLSSALSKIDTSKISKIGTTGLSKVSKETEKASKNTWKLKSNLNGLSLASKSIDSLYSGFSKVNNVVNKAAKNLVSFVSRMRNANKETKNFAQTAGMFYARFYLAIRGIKTLWKSIESSMDYIETLNYFDAAFGQVADEAVGHWKESGYESAESYYKSFSERAKQLTSKMSGFIVSETGNLQATGLPSLGINPETVMKYQAMFAQMSSSMGVASETALKLSDALTMIGADLASVKNMDFEKVWTDMASGLAGMSRTLDKYGVNIRNVNLQQKLMELGINANITALNQNQKALLRTIILLDSTKYAWGDLAETINAPANQIRLLQSNLQNLARMIGNIFLPIIAKLLPYINGLVIALQRLFSWIASLLGIDLSNISNSIGSAGDSMGDLLGDTEDLDESLEDASDSAKKLKNNLLGIDELNIISPETESTLGSLETPDIDIALDDAFLKSLEEYQKAWDEAFSNLENKANDIADRIVEAAKYVFQPISKAWAAEGDFVVSSWKKAFESVKGLISDIGRDLMTVWQQAETVDIFKDIFHIVGDIGLITSNLADNFRKAWNENKTGLKILENIRDIIGEIIHNIRLAADYTVEWSKKLDFSPLLKAFEELTRSLADNMENISGIFTDFYQTVILGLAKWTMEKGLPQLLDVIRGFVDKVDWEKLRKNLNEFWKALERFGETVGEGIIIFIERITTALANFVNSEKFENFLKFLADWMDSVTPEDVADAIEKLIKAFVGLKIAVAALSGLSKVFKTISGIFDFILKAKSIFGGGSVIGEIGETGAGSGGLKGILTTLGGIASKIAGIISIITGSITAIVNFFDMWKNGFDWMNEALMLLGIALAAIGAIILGAPAAVAGVVAAIVAAVATLAVVIKEHWEEIKDFFAGLPEWFNSNVVEPIKNFFNSIGEAVSSWYEEHVAPWFTAEKWSGIWETVKESFSNGWGKVVEWWDSLGVSDWFNNHVLPWFNIERWVGVFGTIRQALVNVWDELKKWWSSTGFSEWIDNYIAPWFTEERWNNIYKVVKDKLVSVWDNLVEWWRENAVSKWFNEHVAPWFTAEKWLELYDKIRTSLSQKWGETVGEWITNIKDWWDNHVASWFSDNKWLELLTSLPRSMKNKVSEFVSEWTSKITSWWNEHVTDWFGDKRWSDLLSVIPEKFKEKFEDAKKWANEKLQGILEIVRGSWAEDLRSAIENAFSRIREKLDEWKDTFANWFENHIGKYFKLETWMEMVQSIPTALSKAFDSAVSAIKGIIDNVSGWFENTWLGKLLSGVGGTINGVFDFIGNAINSIDIPFFASGGFPDAGDIFVANEAGPELIGTIGGKTAVGGGQEITGIRDAVYDTGEAQASLLSSAVELLRIIAEKDTSISLDGRELVDAMNNRNSRNGYNF